MSAGEGGWAGAVAALAAASAALPALVAAAAAFPALALGSYADGPPPALGSYADGPPPAHTGGFGEPSCHACHFDGPLNDPDGTLEVRVENGPRAGGATGGGTDGKVLTVVLTRPGMGAAGFQLSVRASTSGEQAGELVALDPAVEVVEDPESGVQYARQTEAGTGPAAPDSARWRVEWRPPARGERAAAGARGGHVLIHVAANAANDDASEFGDYIYLTEVCVPPR